MQHTEDIGDYLRELGRPDVQIGEHNLRTITRQYAVSGDPERGKILLPYWYNGGPQLDEEFKSACLIKQEFKKSEDNTTDILVRTYQELGSDPNHAPNTDQVEIGRPDYKREANNLVQVTREFLQLRDDANINDWENIDLIGKELFEGYPLATVEADEGAVYVKIKKTYFERGIISSKKEDLHNSELTRYTLRSVGYSFRGEVEAAFPDVKGYFLVSENEGKGNLDYQFGGLVMRTWVFVKGEGLIQREVSELSSGEHVTEVWLTTEEERPTPGLDAEDIYFEEVDHKEQFTLWTFKGISGAGILFEGEDLRFDERVTRVTVRQINDWPEDRDGFAVISSSQDHSGRFPIFEKVFLKVAAGVMTTITETRGSLEVQTQVFITEASETTEPTPTIPNVNYRGNELKEQFRLWTFRGYDSEGELERREDTHANGAIRIISVKVPEGNLIKHGLVGVKPSLVTDRIYSDGPLNIRQKVWVVGDGEISVAKENRGNVVIETHTVARGVDAPDPRNNVEEEIFESKKENKDGYVLYSWKTKVGDGHFYEEIDERHDSTLVITTRRYFGETDIPSDAFSYGIDESGTMKVTWYKTLTGEGVVYERIEGKADGFLYTTLAYVGAAPTHSGSLLSRTEDKKTGYTLVTDVYISTESSQEVIGVTTNDKGITFTTVISLDSPPTFDGAIVNKGTDKIPLIGGGYVTSYKYVFASGTGEFYRNSYTQNGVRRTRVKSIDEEPNLGGCVESTSVIEHNDVDGAVAWTEYDYVFITGSGILSENVEVRGALRFATVRYIGAPSLSAYGNLVMGVDTETLKDIDGNDCIAVTKKTFLLGSLGSYYGVSRIQEGVIYTDHVIYDATCGAPAFSKPISVKPEPIQDVDGVIIGCVTRYTTVAAADEPWLEQVYKNGDGVVFTRYKAAEAPDPADCIMNHTEEDVLDVNGDVVLTKHTYDKVTGSGEISKNTVVREGVTMTTVVSMDAIPAAGSYSMSTEEKQERDINGNVCYTLRKRTYIDNEEEYFEETDSAHENGVRVLTARSYDGYKLPQPVNGSATMPSLSVRTYQGWTYDSIGRKVYTVRRTVAPPPRTFMAVHNHVRMGGVALNEETGEIVVTRQVQKGATNLNVEVSYSATPPLITVAERVSDPVLFQRLVLHDGSTRVSREVYPNYRMTTLTGVDVDGSQVYEEEDKKVEGLPCKYIYRKLQAGSSTFGEEGVVDYSIRLIASNGASHIYETTKITDPI